MGSLPWKIPTLAPIAFAIALLGRLARPFAASALLSLALVIGFGLPLVVAVDRPWRLVGCLVGWLRTHTLVVA